MFAVNTCPRARKLTASTSPVTAVIPSSAYGRIESAVSAFHINQTPLLVRLELVAGPQSPVVEVAPRLRLLQETARIKDPVIRLKPEVAIRLPSDLSAGPMADESRLTPIGRPDQEPRHSVDAILEALPPLKNPVDRQRHVMRKRRFDVRMNVNEVNGTGTCCGKDAKVVALWK